MRRMQVDKKEKQPKINLKVEMLFEFKIQELRQLTEKTAFTYS